MKTTDWNLGHKHGSGAIYKIACSCGDPTHECTIIFELEDGIAEMHFYKRLNWSPWYKDQWFHKIWERIKAASKILFTGWIEMEDELVVDYKYIPDIIKAFEESKQMIEIYEKEWEESVKAKKENVTNEPDNQESSGQRSI